METGKLITEIEGKEEYPGHLGRRRGPGFPLSFLYTLWT
jgi:hypothetical protein